MRAARLHAGRDQLGHPRECQSAEHRERRVGGQQPAPEVARLGAEVDEQRQRHRHEHQPAHETAPQLERGAEQCGDRRGPSETPGEAVEVVGDAARLLTRLRLVRGHLGLVAKVAPPGVERAEQVRVERHEHEPGQARAEREAAERASGVGTEARERGDRQRRERQARRVLERQREARSGAGRREEAHAPVLVRPDGEAERERHAEERAHVRDRDARVRHGQEREGEQRGGHQPLAHAPEPPCGPVGGRDARRAQHRGERAGRDPHLRRVLVELVGDVAERQVEQEAERAVHHAEQHVDQVRVGRGVLVVARVEVLPEHLDGAAREVRPLVDRVDERQPVVDVPEAQREAGHQDQREHEAVHAAGR